MNKSILLAVLLLSTLVTGSGLTAAVSQQDVMGAVLTEEENVILKECRVICLADARALMLLGKLFMDSLREDFPYSKDRSPQDVTYDSAVHRLAAVLDRVEHELPRLANRDVPTCRSLISCRT